MDNATNKTMYSILFTLTLTAFSFLFLTLISGHTKIFILLTVIAPLFASSFIIYTKKVFSSSLSAVILFFIFVILIPLQQLYLGSISSQGFAFAPLSGGCSLSHLNDPDFCNLFSNPITASLLLIPLVFLGFKLHRNKIILILGIIITGGYLLYHTFLFWTL